MPNRRHWLLNLLEERASRGDYIAADPARYVHAHVMKDKLASGYAKTIKKVAKKYGLIHVLGPRGGFWCSMYVPAAMLEAREDLRLRILGMETISNGGEWPWKPYPSNVWRIRHYRGQPYLCLRPRERRWYDPPWGYLVA